MILIELKQVITTFYVDSRSVLNVKVDIQIRINFFFKKADLFQLYLLDF